MPPVRAMSAKPSPLKSPLTALTLLWLAQLQKLALIPDNATLDTVKFPSPFENATGMLDQPAPPVSAISILPSPLKSPATGLAPLTVDHTGNCGTGWLVIVKVPFAAAELPG